MNFTELGLTDTLLRSAEHFKEPTEIQQQAIPLVLEGKDVIAESATGSGKTLAFAARILQATQKGNGIQALILTPTRELCVQVAEALKEFSKYAPLNIVQVYGGVSINPQMHDLRTAEIVVATPGRLLDHMSRGTINLTHVNTLILDEADRMLDMGFLPDVERIITECPRERQTLLFSATVSTDILHLSKNYMNNPEKVTVNNAVDPSKLSQIYYDVPDKAKFSLLVHLLHKESAGLSMIFCSSRSNTDFVHNNLKMEGFKVLGIHGGFSQAKRNKIMEHFHAGKANILVCTDVAARGLDIQGVSHVYNYDIPSECKDYIHRIGRTARAGSAGKAINILASRDHENFSRVLRDLDATVKKLDTPQTKRIAIRWKQTPRRNGFRKSFPRRR